MYWVETLGYAISPLCAGTSIVLFYLFPSTFTYWSLAGATSLVTTTALIGFKLPFEKCWRSPITYEQVFLTNNNNQDEEDEVDIYRKRRAFRLAVGLVLVFVVTATSDYLFFKYQNSQLSYYETAGMAGGVASLAKRAINLTGNAMLKILYYRQQRRAEATGGIEMV